MATTKTFLDLEGLQRYDNLIKDYLNGEISAEELRAKGAEADLLAAINALSGNSTESIQTNTEAINVLNGDDTVEGSVQNQIKNAIADVVDSAPETLDTLKEIADWIESDETGTASITNDIAQNKEDIAALQNKDAELKSYIDAQDTNYFNSIIPIAELSIKALFMTKKTISEGESVNDAISALDKDNEILVLAENSTVDENITIPSGVIINANGSTFSGNLNIASDAIVSNAVFTGKVTIE